MRNNCVIFGSLAVVAAVCVTAFAQEGQRFPGPGSGIIKVDGTVDVRNTPTVHAAQAGEWKVQIANTPGVTVSNTPTVTLAALGFLRVGGRYEVTWPTGERQVVVVSQLGSGGWVRVDGGRAPKGQRWINAGAARSIEEP
jgi:hypothetical protein